MGGSRSPVEAHYPCPQVEAMQAACRLFPACRGAAVHGHIQTSLPATPAHGMLLKIA